MTKDPVSPGPFSVHSSQTPFTSKAKVFLLNHLHRSCVINFPVNFLPIRHLQTSKLSHHHKSSSPGQPPNNLDGTPQHLDRNLPMIQPNLHGPDVQQTLDQAGKRRPTRRRQDSNDDPQKQAQPSVPLPDRDSPRRRPHEEELRGRTDGTQRGPRGRRPGVEERCLADCGVEEIGRILRLGWYLRAQDNVGRVARLGNDRTAGRN